MHTFLTWSLKIEYKFVILEDILKCQVVFSAADNQVVTEDLGSWVDLVVTQGC